MGTINVLTIIVEQGFFNSANRIMIIVRQIHCGRVGGTNSKREYDCHNSCPL